MRIILTVFILTLIGLGTFDYLQNVDPNECSMTYMFQNPNLIPVRLPQKIEKRFFNYKLYLYCEGNHCPANENLRFTKPGIYCHYFNFYLNYIKQLSKVWSQISIIKKILKSESNFFVVVVFVNKETRCLMSTILSYFVTRGDFTVFLAIKLKSRKNSPWKFW